MNKKMTVIICRIFFGILALIAIFTQLTIQIQHGNSVVNFFSFFTNLSNVFAAGVLLYSAIHVIRGGKPSIGHDVLRAAAFIYLLIVGVVFTVLLRDVDLGHLLPWVNNVLHYVMPLYVAIDFLYQPPNSKFSKKLITYWLLFPILYLVYSLIRGSIVGFYPYPFINPSQQGGYGTVALYCVAILILFVLSSLATIWIVNKLRRKA
jgi:hypothetical protein